MRDYLGGPDGVAALIQLAVLAAAVAVAIAVSRRVPPLPREGDARGAHRKARVLAVIGGIVAFGWLVNATVLAYWRSQMPP